MAVPYVKQTWTDGSGGGTPISAARLNVIEQGIYDAQRMPAARVYHTANQTVTNAVLTALAFNSERYDTDTIHDTVTNNSRLTCRTAGVYAIAVTLDFAATAVGEREVQLRLNGTTTVARDRRSAASSSETSVPVSTQYALAVNDYMEVVVLQTSGGSITVNVASNWSPEFMMVRVAT